MNLLKNILIIVATFYASTCLAQYYSAIDETSNLMKADVGALNLKLDNYNFVWNNEYFGPMVKGYTLIGYNAKAAVEYHFSENVKAQGGIYLKKYSGLDKFTTTQPLYSVTLHNSWASLTLGSINGAGFHRLPDPVLNKEQQLYGNNENGAQIVINRNRLFVDVWCDWQNFIFQNDAHQEEIFGGLSAEYKAIKTDQLTLTIPASVSIYHRGGQIDTCDDKMRLLYHFSAGLRINKKQTGWINNIAADARAISFKDNSPEPLSQFGDTLGYGVLAKVEAAHNQSFVSVGYWYGSKFQSKFGNQIFQSTSGYDPLKTDSKRSIVTAELNISHRFANMLTAAFAANVYYDLRVGCTDYNYAIMLILQPSATIHRFGNK